ncbi:MAG: hypothetical protein ACRDSP_10815 [Pseudonocardiaceae bacterium]
MNTETPDDADYDPGVDDLLHDAHGNPIDSDYIDKANHEAEVGYDLEELTSARVGRPSLSEAGDSPQVRFRLPAATRAEAAALAAREGKTLSELARDAIEAYLTARRSA